MAYSYQHISPGFTKCNGARFFLLLSSCIGNEYKTWSKHPMFTEICKIAHVTIFGKPESEFKTGGGLQLLVEFLAKSDTSSAETKKSRSNMYHDALLYAVLSDIITIEFYFEHRPKFSQTK